MKPCNPSSCVGASQKWRLKNHYKYWKELVHITYQNGGRCSVKCILAKSCIEYICNRQMIWNSCVKLGKRIRALKVFISFQSYNGCTKWEEYRNWNITIHLSAWWLTLVYHLTWFGQGTSWNLSVKSDRFLLNYFLSFGEREINHNMSVKERKIDIGELLFWTEFLKKRRSFFFNQLSWYVMWGARVTWPRNSWWGEGRGGGGMDWLPQLAVSGRAAVMPLVQEPLNSCIYWQ